MSKLKFGIIWLTFFCLPWQTRWIFYSIRLNGQTFEYGQLSLYATSLLLIVCLFLIRDKLTKPPYWLWLLPVWPWLSALWSPQPLLAIYYGFIILIASGYFLLARQTDKWLIQSAVVTAAVGQALLSVHQFTNQVVWPSKWLGLAAHYPEVLGQSVVLISGVRILRAYGSLPHPNILAGFLVLGLVLIYQWLKTSQRLSVAYLVVISLLFGALLLTFSRAALFGLIIWLLVVIWQTVFRKSNFNRGLLAYLGCLLLIAIIASPLLPGWLGRFEPNRLERISVNERLTGYQQSEELLSSGAWLVGSGVNNYVPTVAAADRGQAIYLYQPVHNIYLLLLTEWGMIGLTFLIIVIWQLAKFYHCRWRRVLYFLFPWLIMGLFDHWLVSSYFGLIMSASFLGWLSHQEESG